MKKNYDFIFILACLFVFRVIALSASFSDALCLIAVLGYLFGSKLLASRKIESEVKEQITKDKEEISKNIEVLANELIKVKNATESLKAATGFLNKR